MKNPFFRRQVIEIQDDPALRIVGALLALAALAHGIDVNHAGFVARLIDFLDPTCWFFWPQCHLYRAPESWPLPFLIIGFQVLSLCCALLFSWRSTTKAAWWILFFLTLCRHGVILLSFENMGNYHYMSLIATYVFLLLPQKRMIYPLFLIAFYLAASALKFNNEWLSGAALWKASIELPDALIRVGCFYVVYLESVLVLLLLHPKAWVRWSIFIQLILFHAVSALWVGWFYPVTMILLLSIFPVSWLSISTEKGLVWTDLARMKKANIAALAAFFAAQMVPWMMAGTSSLTGEGRLFSLNMFDSRNECQSLLQMRFHGEVMDVTNGERQSLAVRIRCDPMVVFSRIRNLCRSEMNNPDFLGMDVFVIAKRASDPTYRPLLSLHDACRRKLDADLWGRHEGVERW
ncbi:MAG: hypothetical protein KF802_11590 [Bdellovibrionaceae bacterium]|nr:hypothetical protein [Pseudobdellovibrionaceae bacterium]